MGLLFVGSPQGQQLWVGHSQCDFSTIQVCKLDCYLFIFLFSYFHVLFPSLFWPHELLAHWDVFTNALPLHLFYLYVIVLWWGFQPSPPTCSGQKQPNDANKSKYEFYSKRFKGLF